MQGPLGMLLPLLLIANLSFRWLHSHFSNEKTWTLNHKSLVQASQSVISRLRIINQGNSRLWVSITWPSTDFLCCYYPWKKQKQKWLCDILGPGNLCWEDQFVFPYFWQTTGRREVLSFRGHIKSRSLPLIVNKIFTMHFPWLFWINSSWSD